MRVALYLRRSTNEELQADSLRVQRALGEEYARQGGHEIVAVYEDSASGRSIEHRDAFQRLIARVKKGAPFEAILVQNVSRWGRFENTDESAFYEFLCLTHGVEVIYIQETFGPADSPVGPLLKSAKRWMAAEFSREKSRSVQRSQSRVVRLGFMHGGPAPYAMKRVLVRPDGTLIADLVPGDRKALSNMRVKLAPGDPTQIAVLRRIFETYAGGMTAQEVALALNADGICGPKGGRWTPSLIGYLLRNEVYHGVAKYTVLKGRTRSEMRNVTEGDQDEEIVRTPGSYEAVIDEALWADVQQRLKATTWRKTDMDLAIELRQAFERWGHVGSQMLESIQDAAHWATYRNRFRRGYTEALEVAYAEEVAAAKANLRTLLETRFQVREFEAGWLIDDLLYVAFKFAWPRAHRVGLMWPFEFRGEETEDVTIGFGFSPPPHVRAVETFFFQSSRFTKRKQIVGRTLSAKKAPHRFVAAKSPDAILRYVQVAIYFRNTRSEQRLLAALHDLPLVNVAEVARELGWPENATRVLYRKLAARGACVPPLKQKPGRRIDVICPGCGGVRRLPPSYALQLRTEHCFECVNKRPVNKVTIVCPQCGRERRFFPSQVSVMREGANSLCHACALAKGRAVRREWLATRSEIDLRKRAILREVAEAALAEMAAQSEVFRKPVLWSRGHRRSPTLRWINATSGQRERLTLRCADDDIESIAAVSPGRFIRTALERTSWIPSRCDKRNDAAWNVIIHPSD